MRSTLEFRSSGKNQRLIWVVAFFLWHGSAATMAGQGGIAELKARGAGDSIEISWASISIMPVEPYLHYEFQIQKSADLTGWENVGTLIPGGVRTNASEPHSIQVPKSAETVFYRLAYRMNLPESDLSGMDFTDANLRNADFSDSNLSGASFSGSLLDGAVFDGALLKGADLYTGVFGQPRLSQLGGAPEGRLSEFLPPIIYWPTYADFLEEFRGLPGFYVSPSMGLVLLKSGVTVASFNELLSDYQATLVGSLPAETDADAFVILKFPTLSHDELDTLLEALSQEESVERVARDTLMSPMAIPGRGSDTPSWWSWEVDTSSGDDFNWGWEDSRVPQMWNFNEAIEKRDKKDGRLQSIKTGVIDNLIHGEHPDLAPNVVDDLTPRTTIEPIREAYESSFLGGWWVPLLNRRLVNLDLIQFFIGENSDHGTHVTGIIGAVYDNELKIDGVNPFARLVLAESAASPGLKNFGKAQLTPEEEAEFLVSSVGKTLIDGFSQISAKGISVLNLSMGYHLADLWELLDYTNWDFESLKAVVQPVIQEQGREFAALAAGKAILIIAAAGNDSYKIRDSSQTPVPMPAELQSPINWAALKEGAGNILVVEGIDQSYKLFKLTEEEGGPGGSAVGGNISAPGEDIGSLSYDPDLRSNLTGTSQAAPFVTGLAGYLFALSPDLTVTEVKNLIIDNAVADTDGAPRIDAWASALDIDRTNGNKVVLKMLLDIDDGTEDGNLRAEVQTSPTSDRSFEKVYGSEMEGIDYFVEDANGDGGPGDMVIDMADFRRWRDWLLFGDDKPHALNGSPFHDKKDGNGDGDVVPADETTVFPRGDFNGDGIMDMDSPSLMTGALFGKSLTDLQVLIESGLWSEDEDYDVSHLPNLIDSVDITVSAENFFRKHPEIPNGVVAIYDESTRMPVEVGQPELFTPPNDIVHLFTVPTGRTYYVSSEPIETTDDVGDSIKVLMASPAGPSGGSSTIGSYHVKDDERGTDFVVDLVYVEMTTKASYEVAGESSLQAPGSEIPGAASAPIPASAHGVGIIESEPEEEMVDAFLPIVETAGLLELYGPGSYGARGWANDQGTFYCLARTGSPEGYVTSGDPPEMLTFKSRASWTRTFTKQAGVPDPTFHVEPSKLRVLDGLLDDRDLNARSEIRVEKRVHSAEGGWEAVFYSMTEIAGYSIPASGGDHTFHIVDHQGDQPRNELELIEQFDLDGNLVSTIGAEYFQEGYDGTIPVGNLIDGESFEIRYTLKTRATSVPFDELAEAFIGDPLDYGSGMRMEYGQYGELARISGFSIDGDGSANVSFRSNSDFYFILTRDTPGSETGTQIAIILGHEGTGELIDSDPLPDPDISAYHVENFPLDQPRDTDGDGIDDVYELQRPHLFDPLDATDADKDSDGDGLSDLAEYQQGSDPEVPDVIEPAGAGFYPGRVVETGLDSGTVRIADLNGDMLLDAVGLGGTFGASELDAALVSSNGVFQDPLSTALGSINPNDFELFHLNDDTIPDAVVVADPISIFLGDGDGRFTSAGNLSAASVSNVAADDFNLDGALDLFLFSNNDKSLLLFENDGAGSFAEVATFVFESRPWHAVAGRWNDDAFVDIAVTLQAGMVAVILGNDTGFEEPQLFPGGASAERFGAGDVNGDGFTDIVTANKGRDDISVLLANGDGTLASEVNYPTGETPRDVLVGDVNGDDHADLLVSHASSGFHSLFFGDGTGSFVEQGKLWSSPDSRVVLEDWDGDGIPDLISPAGAGRLLVQPGDEAGTFETRDAIALTNASVGDVQLADIDGVGEEELLMLNLRTYAIDVWEHGLVSTDRQLLFSLEVPDRLQAFVVADFNNDDAPDIIALSAEPQFGGSGENKLTVFQNDAGAFSKVAEIPLSARFTSLIAAQLDANPLPDLLAMVRNDDPFTPENEVQAVPLLNQGDGQFSPATALMPGTGINRAIARDLDGDDVDEIIMGGFFGGSALAVFSRNPNGTWTNRQQFNTNVSDFIFADADNDGNTELVTTRQSGGTIVEAYQVANGVLANPEILLTTASSANKLHLVDVDRDSRADILLGNVDIHFAKVEGGWEALPDRYYIGGLSLTTTDLNDDGKPDLVGWGLSADSVSLLIQP